MPVDEDAVAAIEGPRFIGELVTIADAEFTFKLRPGKDKRLIVHCDGREAGHLTAHELYHRCPAVRWERWFLTQFINVKPWPGIAVRDAAIKEYRQVMPGPTVRTCEG